MVKLVFLDTETTGLHYRRRIWDIAWIERDLDVRTQSEPQQRFVFQSEVALHEADPFALKIGHFYERHPQVVDPAGWWETKYGPVTEYAMLHEIERVTRGAHIVGAVPNFDTETLERRMRAHGIRSSWHYHLIDVEALAVGYLAASTTHAEDTLSLPWSSDDLSRSLGVEPAPEHLRHTAVGDADWAMRLFDAATADAYAVKP